MHTIIHPNHEGKELVHVERMVCSYFRWCWCILVHLSLFPSSSLFSRVLFLAVFVPWDEKCIKRFFCSLAWKIFVILNSFSFISLIEIFKCKHELYLEFESNFYIRSSTFRHRTSLHQLISTMDQNEIILCWYTQTFLPPFLQLRMNLHLLKTAWRKTFYESFLCFLHVFTEMKYP